MRFPGLSILSDRKAVKAFESQEASFRDLVFYSEGRGDWPHLGPIIEALLADHDRNISYLTSDEGDPGLRIDHPRLRSFDIGSGTARTVLFARIDCRSFVMTLPDLGNLWLKRSVHPVHYIYAFHSLNSTHTSYRKGAFDNFETILCAGPHHVAEIRKSEEVYGLPPKRLIEHGSAKLDTVMAEVAGLRPTPRESGPIEVLIAPTWGESSLIEQPLGRELIAILLRAGMRTVLRLHPMTSRRLPELVAELKRSFADAPLFALEEDMAASQSWLRSDLMISDWSGAAIEYAMALLKPVVYVDTPPKIMNASWTDLATDSFESRIRSTLGRVVAASQLSDVPQVVHEMIRDAESVRETVLAARSESIFNIGQSSAVAAQQLAALGND